MIPVEYEQFEQVVTVGVTNFTPVWGDTKETLHKIEANLVEAASQGVNIVAFGEEALIGPTECDACRFDGHACEFHAAAKAFEVDVADRHRPEFTQPRARAGATGSANSTPARSGVQ